MPSHSLLHYHADLVAQCEGSPLRSLLPLSGSSDVFPEQLHLTVHAEDAIGLQVVIVSRDGGLQEARQEGQSIEEMGGEERLTYFLGDR